MLKLFEKNTGFQVTLILAVTALLWGPRLAHPLPMPFPDGSSILYSFLYGFSLSPLVATIVALILVLAGAFLLNYILANANLVSQNSLLPSLLFVLFASATTPTLSPSLIVALISIFLVNMLLLHGTLLTVPPEKIFGAAALIGLCILFYTPAVTLLVFYLLVVVNYRLYSWRETLVFLLGLLAPVLPILLSLIFESLLGDRLIAMADTLVEIHALHFPFSNLHSPVQGVANAVLLAFFIVSLFLLWARLGENTVVWQKNATTVMATTATALVVLLYSNLFPVDLLFFAIPFAFCGSLLLTPERRARRSTRHKWTDYLNDLYFILIIVAAVLC